MPSTRRATEAAAHLRQLACLENSGPSLILPVLRELHHLIGFDAGCFIHAGADGELDVFMENPALQAAVPDYFDPRILQSELEVLHRSSRQFGETLREERGVQMLPQISKVPLPELLRSDFYNVVLRPGDVGDGLSLALCSPQGQGVGILKLYRRGWSRRFTETDAAVLGRLEAILTRALQPGETDTELSEICGEGLLIVSPQARLQWVSPGAQGLLRQAFGQRWRHGELPAAVESLIQRLYWTQGKRSAPGGSAAEAELPVLTLHNVHGEFMLRAAPLAGTGSGIQAGIEAGTQAGTDAADPRASEAVAIHITRRVLRGVRLLERLRALGLPGRQIELACWLARGLPESSIADRMGVSANTVVYHRRQLYARLGVATRSELLGRLAA